MPDVVDFPVARARELTARARLAANLREIADLLDRDEVETDPVAALIVLTGHERHEVVCYGYDDDDDGLEEAGIAAQKVIWPSFQTVGGNLRARGDYRQKPMRRANIVDGAFPRKRQPDSALTDPPDAGPSHREGDA